MNPGHLNCLGGTQGKSKELWNSFPRSREILSYHQGRPVKFAKHIAGARGCDTSWPHGHYHPRTLFFWPMPGYPSGMCPSTHFLLSVLRDKFISNSGSSQAGGKTRPLPPDYESAALLCHSCFSHLNADLEHYSCPQLLSCIPCPVNARQARGLVAEVKGHFISVTLSSANENVSPACPREGFLQLQPSCD